MKAQNIPEPPPAGHSPGLSNPGLKLLFLASCPSNAGRLHLDVEAREIGRRIDYAQVRSRIQMAQEWAVTVTDLSQILLRHRPNIVHFSGHGSTDGRIVLEDAQGQGYAVPSEALTELFKLFGNLGLRCVVLNSCYSDEQAKVIANHIEFVIGISGAIKDECSLAFTAGFYGGLAAGETVETALSLGRIQIALVGQPQTIAPRLLCRADANPATTRFL